MTTNKLTVTQERCLRTVIVTSENTVGIFILDRLTKER